MPELLPCVLCSVSCEKGYITIEKNLTGEETIFIDICLECFKHAADSTLIHRTYERRQYSKCLYCHDFLENDMGQTIVGHQNATGKYCAVWIRSSYCVFIHPECYEENIGL